MTPPLGVNLYVASAITGESVEKVSVAVLPFVAVLLAFCVLLILFPWISTIGYQVFTGR
ncbi:TRAP transporter large permease subunit [Rhodobacteraceae bacterium nBUS_22]